jgi:hypothetical protein
VAITEADRRRYARRCTGPTRSHYRWDPDVDPIAVERAVLGDPPRVLTTGERAEVVERLTQLGRTAAQIADVLGVNRRTVWRYRARRHVSLGGPGFRTMAGAA